MPGRCRRSMGLVGPQPHWWLSAVAGTNRQPLPGCTSSATVGSTPRHRADARDCVCRRGRQQSRLPAFQGGTHPWCRQEHRAPCASRREAGARVGAPASTPSASGEAAASVQPPPAQPLPPRLRAHRKGNLVAACTPRLTCRRKAAAPAARQCRISTGLTGAEPPCTAQTASVRPWGRSPLLPPAPASGGETPKRFPHACTWVGSCNQPSPSPAPGQAVCLPAGSSAHSSPAEAEGLPSPSAPERARARRVPVGTPGGRCPASVPETKPSAQGGGCQLDWGAGAGPVLPRSTTGPGPGRNPGT